MSSHPSEPTWEDLLARLNERAAELEAEIASKQQQQPAREDQHEVMDHGEEASTNVRAEIRSAEIERDLGELRAITLARERIDEGSYGQCVDCGTEIDRQRLLAQPTALRCIDCQEKFEQAQRRTT